MDFHDIASIFPVLDEDELKELALDIEANGLLHPIIVYEEKILDGRNRYLACEMAGVEPRLEQFNGGDPLQLVISANLKRRHLTREQRDEVIRKLRRNDMTLQKIADAVGVSYGTAHHVVGDELINSDKLTGADGKMRPAHYAPREEHTVRRLEEDYNINHPDTPVKESSNKPHVAFNSGYSEWYTPKNYIERVVKVMGGIDLDPASTEIANKVVGATNFYMAEDDGLKKTWKGRVFMNPPYASELIGKFVSKLLASTGVTESIVLVNNATETKWFQSLAQKASAVCFPTGRVRFWNPNKESAPLQGQAVLYLGKNANKFVKFFSDLGTTWHK